jgi:hypothetical protein
MSGRATKLLNKTRKLETKVRRNYRRLSKLEEVSEIRTKLVETKPIEVLQNLVQSEQEPIEELEGFSTSALSLERVDYSYPDEKDFGLELQVPAGIITASSIRSGDEVVISSGALEGRSLEVIEVLNASTIRLDDVATFGSLETNVQVTFNVN